MRLAIVNITAGRLSGGYSKYLENLIPYLLQNKEISALLVAIPEGVNFTAWRMKFPSVQWVTLKPRPWSLFSVRNSEKKMIGNFSPDIIFIPTARFCKLGNIAVINMVRNMEPLIRLKNSNNLFHRLKLAIQYQITKNAVFRADRVIAVSDFVKQFLISKWNIPNKKIGMIYYGCKIEEGADSVCQKPSILPKHLKNKGFIFAAGSICAYRGLEDIIEAMGHLKSKNGYLPELVIAGKVNSFMHGYWNKLKKDIDKKGLKDKIFWIGELNANEMRWCYKNCELFLMTSSLEACPNIALEAMSHGCVCICAKNPPLPEFFADCAIYYQSQDALGLADAINSTVKWGDVKKLEISKKALERAAGFSWDKTGASLIDELKNAAKRNSIT